VNRLSELYHGEKIFLKRRGKMNQIEVLLSVKLKTADPTLDILGSDRKILQLATEDFTNYLSYLSFADRKTSNFLPEEILEKNFEDVSSFLTIWIGTWLKKWQQRFKLALDQPYLKESSKKADSAIKANVLWSKLDCREELVELVMFTLIKNSEICGSKIIAEDIVKQELLKIKDFEPNNAQQALTILNVALRKAKMIQQLSGSLVSIRVGKDYYT
jgi:hypothetical protein